MGTAINREQANRLFAGIQNHKIVAKSHEKAIKLSCQMAKQYKSGIYKQACELLLKRMNNSIALQVIMKP